MQWRYGPYFPTMDKLLTAGKPEPGPNDGCRWKGWELSEAQDASSPKTKQALATSDQFFDAVKWTVFPQMIGRETSSSHQIKLQTNISGFMFSEDGPDWLSSAGVDDAILDRAKKKCVETFFSQHWDPDLDDGKCIAFGYNPKWGVQFYNSFAWGVDVNSAAASLSLLADPVMQHTLILSCLLACLRLLR
jgi:hypothetical protein